jgi:predicted nuclease of predicted toxin-antitoxin system
MRFHLDEHVYGAVCEGLRRRGIDVTTTREAGLRGASDMAHIEYARRTGRIIFTEDEDYLMLSKSGVEHCGIVYCHSNTRRIGQIIEYLVLVDACMTEEDMRNHIEFC